MEKETVTVKVMLENKKEININILKNVKLNHLIYKISKYTNLKPENFDLLHLKIISLMDKKFFIILNKENNISTLGINLKSSNIYKPISKYLQNKSNTLILNLVEIKRGR